MVYEKPAVALDSPAVETQPPVADPQPGYQPFDYRKFFDFSFFGNLASQFGGSPQGFQAVQKVPHKQDRLISYTVQKQFAPVQAVQIVPHPTKPQSDLEQVPEIAPAGDFHQGIEKTVYISPFVKRHHLRGHHLHPHHHKRIQVVKTFEIQ